MPGLLMIGGSGAHPAYASGINNPSAGVKDIINAANSKCISHENVNPPPVIDVCDGRDRQDWIISPQPGGVFLIKNLLAGDCLSILNNDTSPGAEVNTHGCNANNHFEQWFTLGKNIANEGIDLATGNVLVMQPSGCGAQNDLHLFMNVADPFCQAQNWNFPAD